MQLPRKVIELLDASQGHSGQSSAQKGHRSKPNNRKVQRKIARKQQRSGNKSRDQTNEEKRPLKRSSQSEALPVQDKRRRITPPRQTEAEKAEKLQRTNPLFYQLMQQDGIRGNDEDQDELNIRYYAKKLGVKKNGNLPQPLLDDGLGCMPSNP